MFHRTVCPDPAGALVIAFLPAAKKGPGHDDEPGNVTCPLGTRCSRKKCVGRLSVSVAVEACHHRPCRHGGGRKMGIFLRLPNERLGLGLAVTPMTGDSCVCSTADYHPVESLIGFSDASPDTVGKLAEFVAYVSLCCAFLRHTIGVEAGSQAHLLMTGREGAREVIASDLARLPPASAASAAGLA